MADESYVTRYELDLLRGELGNLRSEVTGLRSDLASVTGGAAGVPVLQSQMIELVKDVAELKADVNTKFADHLREHEQANRDRVTGRRWMIATAFAGIGAMTGLYLMLFDLLSRH